MSKTATSISTSKFAEMEFSSNLERMTPMTLTVNPHRLGFLWQIEELVLTADKYKLENVASLKRCSLLVILLDNSSYSCAATVSLKEVTV